MADTPKKVVEIENLGPVAKLVIDNEDDTTLTIIKLGDKNKGWIPSAKMFREWRMALNEAIAAPEAKTRIVFSHAFVEIKQVPIPKGKVIVVGPGKVAGVDDDEVKLTPEAAKAFMANIVKAVVDQQRACDKVYLPESVFDRVFAGLLDDDNTELHNAGKHFTSYGVDVYKIHENAVWAFGPGGILKVTVNLEKMEVKGAMVWGRPECDERGKS